MPQSTVMRCLFSTAGLAALVAASWLASAFSGEPPVPDARTKPAEAGRGDPKYEGTRECIRCHKAPTADDIADKITDFYDLTEYPTWAEKDKHSPRLPGARETRGAGRWACSWGSSRKRTQAASLAMPSTPMPASAPRATR